MLYPWGRSILTPSAHLRKAVYVIMWQSEDKRWFRTKDGTIDCIYLFVCLPLNFDCSAQEITSPFCLVTAIFVLSQLALSNQINLLLASSAVSSSSAHFLISPQHKFPVNDTLVKCFAIQLPYTNHTHSTLWKGVLQ